jgi:hypothetical protein
MKRSRRERTPWLTPTLRQEGLRKLFHSLSAGYAGLYALAGRERTLLVLGVAVGVGAIGEAVRLRNNGINQWLVGRFGGIHREKEVNRPSGIFWTLLGCFLTALLCAGTGHCDRGHALFDSGGRSGGICGAVVGSAAHRHKKCGGQFGLFPGRVGGGRAGVDPARGTAGGFDRGCSRDPH